MQLGSRLHPVCGVLQSGRRACLGPSPAVRPAVGRRHLAINALFGKGKDNDEDDPIKRLEVRLPNVSALTGC